MVKTTSKSDRPWSTMMYCSNNAVPLDPTQLHSLTDLIGQYKKNVCQMFADSVS